MAQGRDHRIDWLRGIALVSIFINHMPGNRLENWTTRNFGFSDAAELFVLLAGMAAAFAFFPRMLKGDLPSPLDNRASLTFLKSKLIDDPDAEQYVPQLIEAKPGHFVAEHDPV